MSERTFDYIVIGAGSAGCVLVNRLSADPACSVLLIEAGASDRSLALRLKTGLPLGNILLLPDKRYNWHDEIIATEALPERTVICPRGKLFGGSSSVNGTVYMRGNPGDYDQWEAQGNPGWGFSDVLPAFRRQENWASTENPDHHGSGGELDVSPLRAPNPLSLAMVRAAVEAGHETTSDFNGPEQDGFGLYSVNQRGGQRLSSSRAFLHPAMNRPNLTIFDETLVEKIQISNGRATGLIVQRGGQKINVAATREIILSAGAVNSPHLMMLSGLGPQDQLRKHGIEIVADIAGVGQNLQDHPGITIAYKDDSGQSMALSWRAAPRLARDALRYLLFRTGSFTSNAAEAGGFLRSRAGLNRPDVQVTCLAGLKDNARTIPRTHGYMAVVNVCRPESRGFMELRSASPQDRPVLHANFLDNAGDVETLIRGIKAVRAIFARPALAAFCREELLPGKHVQSDAEIETYIRQNIATVYHPVGTCKMGPRSDSHAVVDHRLRVHGLTGLRIADASIMPTITSGNTSAPSMMIGERAAEFILEDWDKAKAAA